MKTLLIELWRKKDEAKIFIGVFNISNGCNGTAKNGVKR